VTSPGAPALGLRALAPAVGLVLGGAVAGGALVGPLAGPASAGVSSLHPVADDETTPLSVVMTSLTPSVVPRKGTITISGVVANSSQEEWQDVNLAPFTSSTPITTRDDLDEAARTSPETTVGSRIDDPATNVSIGDLAPGQRSPFTIRVPRAALGISGDPGVYWIGVHALGATAEGRDLVADGRARSFIPLVTAEQARTTTVPVSVVVPLRERARRAPDGSLNGPARWAALTGPEGRLTRLTDFAASSGDTPLTWLLDPAVLDALDDYGNGNPPLSLSGTDAGQDDSGGGQPDASPSPGAASGKKGDTPSAEQRARSTSVLETFLGTARTNDLLGLGYSDPDVAALARMGPGLLTRASVLSSRRLGARGLNATPAVAPPSGFFDPTLLPRIPRATTLLLGDQGSLTSQPQSRLPSGQQLVLSDERAGAGGPAPTDAHNPLAIRQRVLAEAALEAEKGGQPARQVVLDLPTDWNPGPQWREADFFGGLDVPWVQVVPLTSGVSTAYRGELAYDRAQRAREIGPANVQATRTLTRTGVVLQDLLTNRNDASNRLTGSALQASSYGARATPRLAADQVLAQNAETQLTMDEVQVTGTDFVTLSGGSGSLTVTLVNGLQQPVTVGLRARTDSPEVRVSTPDPVRMQPGQRITLRLPTTSSVGVHEVRLTPVTSKGEEVGTPLSFSLRTSQVGRLIWYVILAGGVLLAVMILRRIVLRVRNHRWRVGESE
jgi:hypothetical protein